MNLVFVTAPSEEPITLASAKQQMRVDISDDDALIGSYITAARIKCEEISRRAFVTQTLALVLDCWPQGDIIKLPRPPLASVTSLVYKDLNGVTTTFGSAGYVFDTSSEPGRLALAYGYWWPPVVLYPVGGIKITYQAGYGAATAVPENYKQAIRQLAAYYYEARDLVEDVPAGVMSTLMANRGWY